MSGAAATPAFAAVLHEDAALLAVAKPAGVTVIPSRNEPPESCLQHRLQTLRGERLWVVHRLDRDTSGVLLFARTAEAHRTLSIAFETREVAKSYLAWTRGAPSPAEGVVEVPLHAGRKGRMRPADRGEPGALPSRSRYRVVARRETKGATIAEVEVFPETGRQHQIRVHMRAQGAPLVVDPLYGQDAALDAGALAGDSPAIGRLTLHARTIELTHPVGRSALSIESPLPDDLAALARWIRLETL